MDNSSSLNYDDNDVSTISNGWWSDNYLKYYYYPYVASTEVIKAAELTTVNNSHHDIISFSSSWSSVMLQTIEDRGETIHKCYMQNDNSKLAS